MLLQPRSYQVEAVKSIYDYFGSQQGNPVLALPTGTGKSVVIAMFLESVFRYFPNQRVMVLTHVKELIQQNYDKLMSFWPTAPAGIYSAGLNRREAYMPITFAGIASVAKKAHLFGRIDLLIIDEAHLVSPSEETMYQALLGTLRSINPNLKVVGLTATPWRLGHGRITEDGIFTDVCFDITGMAAFNRLIAEGYLCPLVPKQTKAILDTNGIHMRGGEFVQSELQLAVDKDEITFAALKETMEQAGDRNHWLIFASGVQHAENVGAMLNSLGVPTVVIHSKMSDNERDEGIAGFKSGKYKAAVNNNVLTTGFDFPGIDLIVMLRPTASPVLWVQMLGRGTRPFHMKENCLVLDFAGNTRRLGPINDPVIPRKKGQKGGEAPVKLCGSCATYNHASVTHCICCGAEFHFTTKLKEYASTQELIKGEAPIVEVFKVDHITYSAHEKIGAPPMMKVSYYCGLRMFQEYVCIQHEGFAQRKARQWWTQRSNGAPFPESTALALEQAETLQAAGHLRIWVNKKYPEILAHCFDGTAFSTQAPDDLAAPTVDTAASSRSLHTPGSAKPSTDFDTDDDIPF